MAGRFSKENRLDKLTDEELRSFIQTTVDQMSPEDSEMLLAVLQAVEEKDIDLEPIVDGMMDTMEAFEKEFGIEFPHTTRTMVIDPEGIPKPILTLGQSDVDTITMLFMEREKLITASMTVMIETLSKLISIKERG